MTHDDDRALVEMLDGVWTSVLELGGRLDDTQWKALTECPGWTVQDNVAHLIGIESTLLGIPTPEVELPDTAHVRNDIGRMNEQWVQHYRARSGPEVLAELRDVARRRLDHLRALDEAGFGADTWTPVGPGTVRDLLPFRIFDSWVHEQDIRRAVGIPGGVDTAAGRFCLARAIRPLGVVVGKRVAPPEGTTVVFDVRGDAGFVHALRIDGGRAQPVDPPPADAAVTLVMEVDTFVRLVNGRVDPDEALRTGAVTVGGDEALGRAVVANLNTMI